MIAINHVMTVVWSDYHDPSHHLDLWPGLKDLEPAAATATTNNAISVVWFELWGFITGRITQCSTVFAFSLFFPIRHPIYLNAMSVVRKAVRLSNA